MTTLARMTFAFAEHGNEHVSLAMLVTLVALLVIFVPIQLIIKRRRRDRYQATIDQIDRFFPNAMTNSELMEYLQSTLKLLGLNQHNTLVCTSICCDELNRPLENDLSKLYGNHFALGGLSGFPFGGMTGFGAMASHIPDGGSCLMVYGPHVGVDILGQVGTVDRRGCVNGGTCCGSAVAAASRVSQMMQVGEGQEQCLALGDLLDVQQSYVTSMLLPYGPRLEKAAEPAVELPYAMFDIQDKLMQNMIQEGCGKVGGSGRIALVGGIQINTPPGCPDYFLPLRFDLVDNQGQVVERVSPGVPVLGAAVSRIMRSLPGALSNGDLVARVANSLASNFNYGKSTMLATSLCCDELNRNLESDFQQVYGNHFCMGGLAGFAFGGVTSFCAMAAHIPDNGNCVVVYGPHVGVDSQGNVGTVDRRGRRTGGACCGSGVAAAMYVNSVMHGAPKACLPAEPLEAQQALVGRMLLPHGKRLEMAEEPMLELPFALFESQDELMQKIVSKGCSSVPGPDGKIALLGGIQVNTPEGVPDFFRPLRFQVLNNSGVVIGDLLEDLR